MKKAFLIVLSFLCVLTITIVSCSDYDKGENADSSSVSKPPPTNPCHPAVQTFASLDAIQADHKALYDAFMAGNEEEVVFENYELNHNNFYSLRKKDYEMTEGIIANDPSFDPFNYTSDSVLETMLNKDGMVIIGGYLYIWSDGTVIHRAPYSCANYYNLLDYSHLIQVSNPNNNVIRNMKVNYGIEDLVVGLDPRYDFASLSESGTKVDNKKEAPANLQKNACGLEAVMSHDMISYDAVARTVKYKFIAATAQPIGTTPINTFTIPNASQYQSVTITASDGYVGTWNQLYVGQWFEVEINFSNYATIPEVPALEVYLTAIINPLTSNSCSDTYYQNLSISCPLTLSQQMLNYAGGVYQFSIEGLNFLGITTGYNINWSFGDGTTAVTTNSAIVVHTYAIPCAPKEYHVQAYISSTTNPNINLLCTPKFNSTTDIGIGDPCKRETAVWKSPGDDGISSTVSGKKVRLLEKIKKRSGILGGGTVFINKFRCRADGTKTVYASGNISKLVGNVCTPIDISSVITPNPKSRTGKGRLKQRFASSVNYYLDLNNPYTAKFTHSAGFNTGSDHSLTYGLTCTQ